MLSAVLPPSLLTSSSRIFHQYLGLCPLPCHFFSPFLSSSSSFNYRPVLISAVFFVLSLPFFIIFLPQGTFLSCSFSLSVILLVLPLSFAPEDKMTDYRPCMHQAVDLHIGRLVSSYTSFLDSCSVNEEGNLSSMGVDNFLLKLHTFAIIHSTRSLLSIAADYEVNQTLYDIPRLHSLLSESSRNLEARLSQLKKERQRTRRFSGEHENSEDAVYQRDESADSFSLHTEREGEGNDRSKESKKMGEREEGEDKEMKEEEESKEKGEIDDKRRLSSSSVNSILRDLISSSGKKGTPLPFSPFDSLLSSVYTPLGTTGRRRKMVTDKSSDEEHENSDGTSAKNGELAISSRPRNAEERGREEKEETHCRGDLLKALLRYSEQRKHQRGLWMKAEEVKEERDHDPLSSSSYHQNPAREAQHLT
ncbi:hypothetical protein CSUI_001008 [Cystoisospora suis]|uniref:Uncharacterized protein n=1 Tax=Cystoisospora suis TaxID=483139 RepID=A0A2C6LBX5_9APIC|nr:hypothetical protein CSUI_001008 [Cystoisospora suis]